MNRLSRKQIGDIVKYRGLGFNHESIAKKLNVTSSAISYQLQQINKQAKEEGTDATYLSHFYVSTLGQEIKGDTCCAVHLEAKIRKYARNAENRKIVVKPIENPSSEEVCHHIIGRFGVGLRDQVFCAIPSEFTVSYYPTME